MKNTFYRVANVETEQGLWYDFSGKFTGLIHDKFSFCANRNLPMPFDPDIVGWLSATKTLEDLFFWFTKEDIAKLEKHGFRITVYESDNAKIHGNHWVIKQEGSRIVGHVLVQDLMMEARG